MDKILEILCKIDSVSYLEDQLEREIIKLIPKNFEVLKDNLDNLIVRKKGAKPKKNIALVASMDETGLIATKIQKEGSVSFLPLGEIDLDSVKGSVVHFKDDVYGVIGANPIHLQTEAEKREPTKLKDLYIDFGFDSKKEAEKLIEVGDIFSFKAEYEKVANYYYKSKALGDRICCSALVELLRNNINDDITYIFIRKEKTVPDAAKTAIYFANPDYCVFLKPYYIKKESLDEKRKSLLFPVYDGSFKYNKKLLDLAQNVALKNKMPFERIVTKDKNVVVKNIAGTKIGVETALFSFPCKMFGMIETAKINDVNYFLEFLKKFLKAFN